MAGVLISTLVVDAIDVRRRENTDWPQIHVQIGRSPDDVTFVLDERQARTLRDQLAALNLGDGA